MALKIDKTRALRTHRQLTALVVAIREAEVGEPETLWVEWKEVVDPATGADAQFKVAKQIIGFGNRHPDDVEREFEGCGYVVVGIDAGADPSGIPRHDPAVLDDWLVPYVGTDGPVWRADYVKLNERDVLVITVEAPKWGDSFHVLHKGYGNFRPGRSFIRRPGKTVEPDENEMRMLVDRAQQTKRRVRVDVEFDGKAPTLFSYTTAVDEWPKWAEAEQERLTLRLRQEQESPGSFAPQTTFSRMSIPVDDRSTMTYVQEVDEYLAGARTVWQQLIWEEVLEKELATLDLRIANRTDENYAAVQVIVALPRGVYGFTDDDGPRHVSEAGEPPIPWGESNVLGGYRPSFDLDGIRPVGYEPTAVTVGEQWKVTFPARHLRPREALALPSVYLAIPEPNQHGEIAIEWSVTSTSAGGRPRGTLIVPVAPGGTRVAVLPQSE